jgi:DNA-binding transcriptional ArsR family regulator
VSLFDRMPGGLPWDEGERLAHVFKALGDPNRLRILSLLAHDWLPQTALVEDLPVSQPTAAHHLKRLRAADLVYDQWPESTRQPGHTNGFHLHRANWRAFTDLADFLRPGAGV